MKKILILIICSYLFSEDITIKDGKFIILKDNGTWDYINEFPIISWEEAINKAKYKKILDVPIYTQSSKRVAEGWCGHTSLQMIFEYYGDSYTQKKINKANSNSDNPTIFLEDLVPVIEKITEKKYKAHLVRFFSANSYRDWIKNQIDLEKPVIATFKMNPTKNPEWAIDHFSIISGYDERGIYILTTWDSKEEGYHSKEYRTWEQLLSKEMNGLSFIGSYEVFEEGLFIAFDIYE